MVNKERILDLLQGLEKVTPNCDDDNNTVFKMNRIQET